MVQPLDFTFKGVQDPLEAVRQGLEFGQAQALRPELLARDRAAFERQGVEQQQADVRFGQGNVLFDQQQQDRQAALADADRDRQNAIQMQADLEVLADNPTAEGFAAVITRNPEIATEMNQAWQILDKDQQQSTLRFMGDTFASIQASIKSGDGARTVTMLEDRVEALNNTPGREEEAQQTQAYLEMFKADPESALVAVGVPLKVLGGTTFDTLLGKGPAVQSVVSFQNGTLIKVFKDGTREVTNPDGAVVEGPAAARAVAEANEFETQVTTDRALGRATGGLEARIDLGGAAAATEAGGKQAVAKSGDLFDQFSKTRTSISNIQEAIASIDDGAKAGLIYRRIPDITKESASLQNALDRMGLDVISATTFGALSAGEMQLAMETAAPRNLSAPDLRTWLQEKQTAQEKVAAMLLDAAQFLGTPGNTLADWIVENGAEGQPAGAPPAEGTADDELDALLNQLGANQ